MVQARSPGLASPGTTRKWLGSSTGLVLEQLGSYQAIVGQVVRVSVETVRIVAELSAIDDDAVNLDNIMCI